MRLIDADELLRTFTVNSDGRKIPEKDCDNFDLTISLKEIKRIIKERPTAYDVGKVVKELNEWTFNANVDVGDGTVMNHNLIVRDTAIEIVKAGGNS